MSARSSPTENDLIEMNREIAALIRAGIPLELGMRSISGGAQTSFDGLAERMAEHLSQGRSLAEAFAEETSSISPVYAAVVDAGSQTGKLPEALDSVARSAEVVQDIRQRLGLAMIYPLICLIVAMSLAAEVISIFVPRVRFMLEDFRIPADRTMQAIYYLHQTLPVWYVQIPLLAMGLLLFVYVFRFGLTRFAWSAMTSLKWVPGFGRVESSLKQSQFLELLALQASYGIPLEVAFPRAASVTEEPALKNDAGRIATALKAGRSLREALAEVSAIPASWKCIFVTSHAAGLLPVAIRQLAETSRHGAARRTAWFNLAVPTALALTCSAAIVLAYALVILMPVVSLWKGLGHD